MAIEDRKKENFCKLHFLVQFTALNFKSGWINFLDSEVACIDST